MKLKQQLHVGIYDPIKKVEQPLSYHIQNKYNGGLFSSTYLGEEIGSQWIQWCLFNEFNVPENGIWNGYLIDVKSDARIYVIDSVEDMERLYDQYGFNDYNIDAMESIDYHRVSQDYDAVHLTDRGQVVTRHPYLFRENSSNKINYRSMYSWDCESTHFFRNVFDKVKQVKLKIDHASNDFD
jgi:hypothetical protein